MFKFISAGVTPDDVSQRIFVKYKKGGPKIECSHDIEKKLCIVNTPDRILYITKDLKYVPPSFDEYVSPNIYEYGSVTSKYCDHILFSAHNWKKAGKLKRESWCSNPDIKVVIDSGGAQLRFGTALFVNPKKIMDVYNTSADIAVALDIPPRPIDKDNQKGMDLLAKMQSLNTETFKKLYTGKRDVKFKNVLHGFNLEQHKRWMEIVDDKFYQAGWAIGFDTYSPVLNILQVFQLIESAKNTPADKIHFLGVSGKRAFPYLAWFGKYIPTLTCDSSQHVHTAIRARILESFTPDGKLTQWKLGKEPLMDGNGKIRLDNITPYASIEMPSSNPLMSVLKYAAVFEQDTGTGMSNILAAHNLINNARINKWWVEVAENSTLEQYEKICRKQIKNKNDADHLIFWLHVIEYCVKNGFKKGVKKYDHLIKESQGITPKEMNVLFGTAQDKRSSMENMAFKNSALTEVLPNYLSYKDMKDYISLTQYEKCKIETYKKGKKELAKVSDDEIRKKVKNLHEGWSLDREK